MGVTNQLKKLILNSENLREHTPTTFSEARQRVEVGKRTGRGILDVQRTHKTYDSLLTF